MTRIIAITNQKGGVGKTTTAINLGTALAAVGERVAIVDLDPQGNASTGLGIMPENRQASTYDLLMQQSDFASVSHETSIPNLSVLPSTLDLLGFEADVGEVSDRSMRLKQAIEAQSAQGNLPYDYVLIDCPPSLNLLTLNAMASADAVLVPLQCEFFALEGLSQLVATINQVKDSLNPALEIQGIVLTMYDGRNKLAQQVVDDVRSYFGNKVYNTLIPRNVRVSEAPSHGKPVLLYDMACAGSQAYIQLATEIIERERALVA